MNSDDNGTALATGIVVLLVGIWIASKASNPYGQDPISSSRTGIMAAAVMLIGFIVLVVGIVRWLRSGAEISPRFSSSLVAQCSSSPEAILRIRWDTPP